MSPSARVHFLGHPKGHMDLCRGPGSEAFYSSNCVHRSPADVSRPLPSVLVYSDPIYWLQLRSCLTHMEGMEFRICVDNLWAFMITHHPRIIKLEAMVTLCCDVKSPSSPCFTFSTLPFPRPGHLQSQAREQEAIFHSLKHSFHFTWLWARLFPYGPF